MDSKFWRDLAAFCVIVLLFGLLIWVIGETGGFTSPREQVLAWRMLIAFAVVGLLVIFWTAATRMKDARRLMEQWQEEHPASPVRSTAKQVRGESFIGGLRRELRSTHGLRWRYRRPWIFLTGDDAVIGRLIPQLNESGWHITDDAVLLSSRSGADGRPDETWLRQIYRLRRSRPMDAVVLAVDGTADLAVQRRGTDTRGMNLARIAELLRWSAPVYVLDVAGTGSVRSGGVPVTGCEFARPVDAQAIETALLTLRDRLADQGVWQLVRDSQDSQAAELSARLDNRAAPLAQWIASLSAWQRRPLPIAGAFFTHWPATGGTQPAANGAHSAHPPLWAYLAAATTRTSGRRTWTHPATVISTIALAFIALWTAGMLISGTNNAHEVMLTNESLQALNRAGDTPGRLRALLGLQQRIALHEARVREHTPLFTRFGLNHDRALLNALWTPYARATKPLLVAPVQQDIEGQLVDLGQMSTAQIDTQSSQMAQDGQQALKTYLMMAEPRRADPAFMTPQLGHHWNLDTSLRPGEKLDLSAQLMGFWAQHLAAHPDWRIQPREDLVGNARQTLLAIIGVENSEDTIYRGILDTVGHKYPDQTLASLTAGTDTRGLFSTSATVPGVFTRQAWEGSIEAAIDEAAKHNGVEGNWVLGNAGGSQAGAAMTPEALRASLRAHYFSDYVEHWQNFMNGIRCEAVRTLPAAVGQLKLIADARQSPLVALMKSLAWQGGAGAQQASLSDALVTRAQNLFGKKDEAPQAAHAAPAGPLDASFGPVLKLVGQASNGNAAPAAGSDLSMERFTERVTTLRLKLQQISDSVDPDEHARQVAQALFQGKGSEFSDTLGYAQLAAASLGEQWAGMGGALFVQPIEQATQTVLRPAQTSLNDAWRQTIVAAWNRSFAGRYPFSNTANDASLPELARFVRPQGGLIDTFLSTQLAGALQLQGDQWVAASGGTGAGSTTRAFDPEFLKAVNTLRQIASHLLAQGEPQYTFALEPVPTPGIADTLLTLDAQTLHYYNQVQTWHTMTWPSGDPQSAGTRLEWQTDTAGTNKGLEFSGRWALVRMLERARVEPVDSATYQLTWQAKPENTDPKSATTKADGPADPAVQVAQEPLAPAPSSMTHPLRYLIRTDVGKGPLELLTLRGFTLPMRIFVEPAAPGAKVPQAGGPPPLPKAALTAATQSAVPIPQGQAPQ